MRRNQAKINHTRRQIETTEETLGECREALKGLKWVPKELTHIQALQSKERKLVRGQENRDVLVVLLRRLFLLTDELKGCPKITADMFSLDIQKELLKERINRGNCLSHILYRLSGIQNTLDSLPKRIDQDQLDQADIMLDDLDKKMLRAEGLDEMLLTINHHKEKVSELSVQIEKDEQELKEKIGEVCPLCEQPVNGNGNSTQSTPRKRKRGCPRPSC